MVYIFLLEFLHEKKHNLLDLIIGKKGDVNRNMRLILKIS